MSGARRLGALVAVVGAGLSPFARAQEPTGFLNRAVTVDGVRIRYQVYVPAEYSRAHRWPVILFLHGAGERGIDGRRGLSAAALRSLSGGQRLA